MPRNMSFFITQSQVREKSKDITRRLGWKFVKAGDIINACEKCQGLRKGEKVVKIGQIQILSSRWEPLHIINQQEVTREGFPDMTPAEFVEMFCRANKCEPNTIVNRIEFQYL